MQTGNATFVLERILDAPIEKVWNAISNRDEMKKWYFDLDAFKPEAGFRFSFKGLGRNGEMYVHHCEVTEAEPMRRLTYSWSYEALEGISYVTFELVPEGDRTRLKLTHRGLASFRTDNPDFAPESFEQGWTELIGKQLPAYLATR